MRSDLIVIGGGAAGLVAAGFAARRGLSVTVLEKNDRPGRKLMITGKGRCNVTNACTLVNELMDNIPENGRFLYSSFSRLMPYDMMELLESLGVELKIERGNRVFPVTDQAVTVVDALVKFSKSSGAVLRTGVTVKRLLLRDGAVCGAEDTAGRSYEAAAVIVATGGMSYPLTGSTGDGYAFARSAGHTVIPPRPSLVPLETENQVWRQAQGLTLKNIAITVTDLETYREVYSDFGELLFTHFGVSGPVILSASAHLRDLKPDRYELKIDLKPALSAEKLDARLVRELTANANRSLANTLTELLPRSLIPVMLTLSGLDGQLKANQVTREMRGELAYQLKNMSSRITRTRPIEEAVVTAGGVKTSEIDPRTMGSKLCRGLYFAGEVIDVDAYTGGFNLQIAFSTAAQAAAAIPLPQKEIKTEENEK